MAQQRYTTIKDAYQLFLLDGESWRFTAPTLTDYRSRLAVFVAWTEPQQITHTQNLTTTHIKLYRGSYSFVRKPVHLTIANRPDCTDVSP